MTLSLFLFELGKILITLGLSTLVFYGLQRKKLIADTKKTESETGSILVSSSLELVKQMQIDIASHKERIISLEQQIGELKDQEKEHNNEREQLKEKISELKEENLKLRNKDIKNTQELNKLKKKIKDLELKLN